MYVVESSHEGEPPNSNLLEQVFMWSDGKEHSEELWYNLLKKCK